MHFTYPELYIFFSFSIVLFLLTCGLSFTLSNLFISSWLHFTMISKIYRRKTREMQTSAILALGVSRQMAQRYTVYVMYANILYVVHFVTSLTSSETQGQSVSFQAQAEEPLGTDSHRTISKRSSECWLLIGHKKCFVLLCPIGEQHLLSSFREFVHDATAIDSITARLAYAPNKCTQSGKFQFDINTLFQNTGWLSLHQAVK